MFVIRADGREVYRSTRLEPGRRERFDVDLTGVEELERATENGSGKASAGGCGLPPC